MPKGLLPHHSVPRLGSACPHSGIAPRAAATARPWPVAAKPASCRFNRSSIPACGHRGLTGRLRSKSKSRARRPESRPEWCEARADQQQIFLWPQILCVATGSSVGAGLLAKAVDQSPHVLTGTALSRAIPLPQFDPVLSGRPSRGHRSDAATRQASSHS